MTRGCSIEGCLCPHYAKGMCCRHYGLQRREALGDELRRRGRDRYRRSAGTFRARARRSYKRHGEGRLRQQESSRRREGALPKLLIGPKGATGYRGVSRHRQSGRYRARIRKGGVFRSLGLFDTPEDAARAYNLAVKHLYGDTPHFLNEVPIPASPPDKA